jgi:hypothetical protein
MPGNPADVDAAFRVDIGFVVIDDLLKVFDGTGRIEAVCRGIDHIIQQVIDGCGGDVHAGVGRGIVNKDLAVVVSDPAVGEYDIGNIPYPFFADGCDQVTAGFVDDG